MEKVVVEKSNFHILTCIRIRPAIAEDFSHQKGRSTSFLDTDSSNNFQESSCVEVGNDGKTVKLLRDSLSLFDKPKCYLFDHVFGFKCTQIEVYRNTLRTLVENLVDGYNGTCFVYGQTGSGKTFTMFGSEQLFGIAHLAINDIFEAADRRKEDNNLRTTVSVSFIQVYVEQVYDLLVADSKRAPVSLNIQEDAKKGIRVENLRIIPVANKEECHGLVSHGLNNRRVRSTEYNMKSSRSHAILQLHLDIELNSSRSNTSYRSQKLTLVDLAGAERPNNYKISSKQHFKEAVIINKSISALGNCIKALATISYNMAQAHAGGQTTNSQTSLASSSSSSAVHVPFRDCRLTRLLAVPLGGHSKICLIANIGPCAAYYDETISTLKFASRAITVTKAVKKETAKQASFPLSKFLLDPVAISPPPNSNHNDNNNNNNNNNQENSASKSSPGQVDYTSDLEDASQLTSMDELSTLHSSSHATVTNYNITTTSNNKNNNTTTNTNTTTNNNPNNKFSVQEFLSMKRPGSGGKSSPFRAVYPIFSQSSNAWSGSRSPDRVGPSSSSLCSYTFDDSLVSKIEQQQKQDRNVMNSIDDFDAGVDAIRVYKLKTANKQIQKIIRERSPAPPYGSSSSNNSNNNTSNSTVIRYKKSPIANSNNGSLSLSEDPSCFASRESLYVSADMEDNNDNNNNMARSSFYSVSREQLAPSQPQPNIHLISLDSQYAAAAASTRRSKSAATTATTTTAATATTTAMGGGRGEEEWMADGDGSINDKSVGEESTALDSFTTPFRSEDKKLLPLRASASAKKQLFEEGGTLTDRFNPGRPMSSTPPVKEMSLLSFLNTRSRRDGSSTPNYMGSVHSTDLDLTPSPPPPPPPPPLPPLLLMAPFSPAYGPSIHAPDTVVTLCLPSSNPYPNLSSSSPPDDLSPESDSDAQLDLVALPIPPPPPLLPPMVPVSEEKISTAVEMARSFCKEFQSIFTAAPAAISEVDDVEVRVAAAAADGDQGKPSPSSSSGSIVAVTVAVEAPSSSSSSKDLSAPLPSSLVQEMGGPVAMMMTPDVNIINNNNSNTNESVKEVKATSTRDSGDESGTEQQQQQPDMSGFFDGGVIDDERKMLLLGQLNRNKLVSLVLDLQQEVSKKSREINELQTFILDL